MLQFAKLLFFDVGLDAKLSERFYDAEKTKWSTSK
jgi:hypothetical protein